MQDGTRAQLEEGPHQVLVERRDVCEQGGREHLLESPSDVVTVVRGEVKEGLQVEVQKK